MLPSYVFQLWNHKQRCNGKEIFVPGASSSVIVVILVIHCF